MVTDTGGFSSAALSLATSQSSISKHVAALEAHVNARLFNRTTRSLTLTTDGAKFYENAIIALGAIEAAETSIGLVGAPKGVVRLTAPLTLAESRIIPMLKDFLSKNPNIEIDFSASDHALNLVADNLDMAIRVGQLADNRLIARKIGLARRILVASPHYLAQAGRPFQLGDLARHNCLLYSLHSAGAKWVFKGGGSVAISGNFRADSPNALRSAALAGFGIALNAIWLFEAELGCGTLERVLPDWEPQPMPIHILLPQGRFISARVRALIEFLTDAFAQDSLLAPGD